ncbi:hypothetical protein BDN72DRAFT_965059 [Pluteus cervinus]|uniref:Uncharacterized protein n=1 Tax=Pluteus cervinus TaxID=181527 RepID=A0ACD3A7M1_9AGAR|nr:hypothetical protein BDN72DRAFT_965059 [Pluteus cervinus]
MSSSQITTKPNHTAQCPPNLKGESTPDPIVLNDGRLMCRVKGCGKAYYSRESYGRHYKETHIPDNKPFGCPNCGYRSPRKTSHDRHVRSCLSNKTISTGLKIKIKLPPKGGASSSRGGPSSVVGATPAASTSTQISTTNINTNRHLPILMGPPSSTSAHRLPRALPPPTTNSLHRNTNHHKHATPPQFNSPATNNTTSDFDDFILGPSFHHDQEREALKAKAKAKAAKAIVQSQNDKKIQETKSLDLLAAAKVVDDSQIDPYLLEISRLARESRRKAVRT